MKNSGYLIGFFVALLVFQVQVQAQPLTDTKPVLVISTHYNGALNPTIVRSGKVFILVKPNPSKLTDNQLIFQTSKYNIYAAANWLDLENDNAFKRLMAAKFNKDGTIKVYTLANIGYSHLRAEHQKPNETILVNNRGNTVRVQEINLPFIPHPIYDENKKVGKSVAK